MSAPPCSCGHMVYAHGTQERDSAGCHHKGCRCGSYDGITHVLMPNMGYACGGSILTKVGASRCGAREWDRITCPDCRAFGRDYLIAWQMFMQGHGEHPDLVQIEAPEHHAVTVGEQMDLFEVAS